MKLAFLVILMFSVAALSFISCTAEIEPINNMHESTTLLVLYKDKTTSKSISELEKTLPQHSSKSLNSPLMFVYQFLTIEDFKKAKNIFENATFVNKISKDRTRKIDPVF